MIRQRIMELLPPPDYRAKVITGWQQTDDIIKAINQQHKINLPYAAKIKHLFYAGSERATAKKIHDFLRNEIQYKVESGNKQTTKSLSRFVHDGFGDCKHFSIFTNCIMDACGFMPCYRYAGYTHGKGFVHVYSYFPKSKTICDAVLPGFNTEKTPLIKKDIKMSLYRLSGVDEIGAINFDKIKKNVAKANAKASNVVNKAVKEIPNAAKKLASTGNIVSMAVPRNAFLGLVKLNVRGLATGLSQVIAKKGTGGLQFWELLGGNMAELTKVIQSGASKKRIMGPVEESESYNEIYGGYSADGVSIGEPVTIATALASAAPIILKVTDVLKKAGIKPEDVKKVVDASKQANADFEKLTGKKVTDVVFKKDAGKSTNKASISSDDVKPMDNATAEKVVTAAVAKATDVDMKTITDIKNDISATSSFETATMPVIAPTNVPFVPDPNKPVDPLNTLMQNKTLIYVAGAALVFILLSRSK